MAFITGMRAETPVHSILIFAVTRFGAGKTSSPPLSARTTEMSLPSAPCGLRIDGATHRSITLKWDRPLDDGGSRILKYELLWTTDQGEDSVSLAATDFSFTISDLRASMTIRDISVRCANQAGFGLTSTPKLIARTLLTHSPTITKISDIRTAGGEQSEEQVMPLTRHILFLETIVFTDGPLHAKLYPHTM